MSHYSQTFYQSSVIETIITCSKDTDLQIRVFCTKALRNAGSHAKESMVRAALLSIYRDDKELKGTVVRTFIYREDQHEDVQKVLLEGLKKTDNDAHRVTLLDYFEKFGASTPQLITTLTESFVKFTDAKTKRSVVKVLSEKGEGETKIIELLAACATSKDTPLALICLSGLERQGKKDPRSWAAVEKTLSSDDADMILATLDVINALPETTNVKIAARLIEIIDDTKDDVLREKALLALGHTGDRTQEIIRILKRRLADDDGDESVRVAAAISLGQQGLKDAEATRKLLGECQSNSKSASLRTACQIGMADLENRGRKTATEAPTKTTP